jgi:hypothetical protein
MQADAVHSWLVATDHRGAEAGERGTERGILDSSERPVKLLAFLTFEGARPSGRRRARGERTLLQGEPGHGAVAEKGVDALDQ